MHEIRIASDLADIVLEVAEKNKLSKVTRVDLCFGSMVQIEPSAFEFAFRETVKETSASGAQLTIEIIPVKLKCRGCGSVFGMADDLFSCERCKSGDIDIINGKELFIKTIEGE